MTKKVYLAGPDVFETNAIELGKKYCQYAASIGLKGLFPLDNTVDFSAPKPDQTIFELNRKLIDEADYVVANLNDFRGLEPDSGTVWEVAYAIGRGKPVIVYTKNNKTMLERIAEDQKITEKDGLHYDKDGKIIENFGNPFNLMIQYSATKIVFGNIENALDEVAKLEIEKTKTKKPKI